MQSFRRSAALAPSNTQYHAQPQMMDEPKQPESHVSPFLNDSNNGDPGSFVKSRRSKKNIVWLVVSLVLGVAWLGPILFLLVVNIKGQVIGASAWCPTETGCNVISYEAGTNFTTATLSEQYALANRDLLGALQFVAKALEVWYMYIAASLLWYATVLLARRPGGLPVGYLLTHMEFGDLRALIDPLLYFSAGGRSNSSSGRSHRLLLYLFVFLVVSMCILSNLIGPSVAVLLLPTLNWNSSPQFPDGQFAGYLSSEAPAGDNVIKGCSASDFTQGWYNCTELYASSSLDNLIMGATQEDDQFFNTPFDPGYSQTYYPSNTARTQEASIPFSFNVTSSKNYNQSSDMIWAFSRQTLRDLSADFEGLHSVVLGNTTDQALLDQYQPYNSSFQLIMERYGPIVGMSYYMNWGTVWETVVGDDKLIRCYQGYSSDYSKAKCLRTGTAWNSTTAITNFYLDVNGNVSDPVYVVSYWSDRAVYIDGTPDSSGCFPNGTVSDSANCDYDNLFANAGPGVDPDDRSLDMFMVEFTLPYSAYPNFTYSIQFFPAYGFATYSIDVTEIFPTLPAAVVTEPPEAAQMRPLALHPAWFLAAWSVPEGYGVAPYSDRSFYLQQAVVELATQNDPDENDASYLFRWYTFYAVAQAVSLVPYNTLNGTAADADAAAAAFQPQLWSGVYNETWGWSTGSRTAKLGVGVCALAAASVLLRTLLLLAVRVQESSSLELITTAIRHGHRGEISSAGDRELDRARVRYRIIEDEEQEGLRLEHVHHPDLL